MFFAIALYIECRIYQRNLYFRLLYVTELLTG